MQSVSTAAFVLQHISCPRKLLCVRGSGFRPALRRAAEPGRKSAQCCAASAYTERMSLRQRTGLPNRHRLVTASSCSSNRKALFRRPRGKQSTRGNTFVDSYRLGAGWQGLPSRFFAPNPGKSWTCVKCRSDNLKELERHLPIGAQSSPSLNESPTRHLLRRRACGKHKYRLRTRVHSRERGSSADAQPRADFATGKRPATENIADSLPGKQTEKSE